MKKKQYTTQEFLTKEEMYSLFVKLSNEISYSSSIAIPDKTIQEAIFNAIKGASKSFALQAINILIDNHKNHDFILNQENVTERFLTQLKENVESAKRTTTLPITINDLCNIQESAINRPPSYLTSKGKEPTQKESETSILNRLRKEIDGSGEGWER